MTEDEARLVERLLHAAGRGYVDARLHSVDPPPKPSDCARSLGYLNPRQVPEVVAGIDASVPLSDLLAAVAIIRRAAHDRRQLAEERRALDSWIAAWQQARDVMTQAQKQYKTRALEALRVLGLHGRRKDRFKDDELIARWGELTTGMFDFASGIQHPKLSPRQALERIAEERYSHADDPASAARQALHRAGVKNLPRV